MSKPPAPHLGLQTALVPLNAKTSPNHDTYTVVMEFPGGTPNP